MSTDNAAQVPARSCEHGCNGCDDCTDYEEVAQAPAPTKDQIQSAAETWAERVCPSGDVDEVQRQWEASDDYDELFQPQPISAGAAQVPSRDIARFSRKDLEYLAECLEGAFGASIACGSTDAAARFIRAALSQQGEAK